MNKTYKVKKRFFVLCCLPLLIFGQQTENEKAYYNWFDQIVGREHTNLYNGRQYVDLDINRIVDNKHAFFKSDEILKGSVRYDDQVYYDTGIKYNLELDEVLVTLKPGAIASILQLNSTMVQEFVIGENKFVRQEGDINRNIAIDGFYEVLLENSTFRLFKKYQKQRKKILQKTIRGNTLNYEFISSYKYFLFVDDKYTQIQSKSDVIKLYSTQKKEIKTFYGNNKNLRKSDPDRFIKMLFEKIAKQTLSSKEL